MIFNAFRSFWYNYITKKQFTPNEKDIKDAKNLAYRLKGETDSETLNNILEWQERNLSYWVERGYLDSSLSLLLCVGYIFIFAFLSIPLFIFLNILFIQFLPQYLSSYFSLIVLFLFFFWLILKASTLLKILYVILWSYPLYEFVKMLLLKNVTPEKISLLLNLTVYNWAIFGISLFSLFYLIIIYRPLVRYEKTVKEKLVKVKDLIISTFEISLPLQRILKYRMAICRDYAKLTAAVLLNLYPKNRIFFFTFPSHVATGIEINGKIYILDQQLPVVNEQAWLNRWERDKATKLELKRRGNKFGVVYLGEINRREKVKLETQKQLIETIENAIKRGKKEITYTLKDRVKIYDINDEVIRDSLVRHYTLLLQREFTGNFSKIKKLDITKKGNDLILHVLLK